MPHWPPTPRDTLPGVSMSSLWATGGIWAQSAAPAHQCSKRSRKCPPSSLGPSGACYLLQRWLMASSSHIPQWDRGRFLRGSKPLAESEAFPILPGTLPLPWVGLRRNLPTIQEEGPDDSRKELVSKIPAAGLPPGLTAEQEK